MKLLPPVLALAALVVATCGGSDTTVVQTATTQAPASTSPAASAKSKADYIARADKICSDYRICLGRLGAEGDEDGVAGEAHGAGAAGVRPREGERALEGSLGKDVELASVTPAIRYDLPSRERPDNDPVVKVESDQTAEPRLY